MIIKFAKLDENAITPKFAFPTDAGADLYSITKVFLYPGERQLVGTGIAVEIPLGYVGLVHPKSGLANNHGLTVLNTPGTIDSGYRGEVKVNLVNLGDELVRIDPYTKIAQLVIQEVCRVEFEEVTLLSESDRGTGGHGSTGLL